MRVLAARLRLASWLGWQIESNWADPLTFVVYSVLRPVGTALILAGMFWSVSGGRVRPEGFALFYVANAFHEYVVRVLVGMGWIVVEEREDYETLRYVYTSPVGLLTYLTGRSSVKFALATLSAVLILGLGWSVLGVRWDPSHVRILPLLLTFAIGLVATLFAGFIVAGMALVLPRNAINLNEGLGVALFLLCGVTFPIDLLPHGLRELSLLLPFTYWYEALRRFLVGRSASAMLATWSDVRLLAALAISTVVLAIASRFAFAALERRARRLGRLDHSTLF
jgi:ABC-2 type transport system permease protein